METRQKYLDGLYEYIDVLKQNGEKQVSLLYDRQARNLCVMKQQSLDTMEIYRSLKAMQNRHIPIIYRVFQEAGHCIVLEEYISGRTFSQILDSHEPLNEEEIEDILRQLCECLLPLHENNIIHRDIKPSNLLLTNDGILKLIDFGIARTVTAGNKTDTVCFGTRGYSPPEQYGFGQTDARSDIYSMGMTIRMLCPHSSKLLRIVEKATQFAPKDRYSSVREILQELQVTEKQREGLAVKARRIWGQLRIPVLRQERIDAKSVEEILAEKLLSFQPALPPFKDYTFAPGSYTLEPIPHCPDDDRYIFPSKESALHNGLQAFEQFIYSQRNNYIKQALVMFRKLQLTNYCTYEVRKGNYYHGVDRQIEHRIREILDWGEQHGLSLDVVPKGLEAFSCPPSFHEKNEKGSHLWNLEHFEDMEYTAPIHELLDKWSDTVPPIVGYKRYIKTPSRLIGIAESKDGEDYEICPTDLYAFRTDEANKQLQENVLYAVLDLVMQSDALRTDIHGAIREAYGERLQKALKDKAENLRKYFLAFLNRPATS